MLGLQHTSDPFLDACILDTASAQYLFLTDQLIPQAKLSWSPAPNSLPFSHWDNKKSVAI